MTEDQWDWNSVDHRRLWEVNGVARDTPYGTFRPDTEFCFYPVLRDPL